MDYLACPYSDPDPAVRQRRYEAATRAAARLFADGHHVFSPLTHSHPMVVEAARLGTPLATDAASWRRFDETILRCCHADGGVLHVLQEEGFRESYGVQSERALGKKLDMPTNWLTPIPPAPANTYATYSELPAPTQRVIRDLAFIVAHPNADNDERDRALNTIIKAVPGGSQ